LGKLELGKFDLTSICVSNPSSQVLTAVVAVVLLFRFIVKAWVYWALPKVSSPERIWGLEDAIFLFAYACDILHMVLIQKR
jgi:hypothetical protein